MNDADRVLPHDLAAERAVLGAILLSAKAWADVAIVLRAADFYRDAHRRIYEAMSAIAVDGVVDMITLRSELAKRGDLDEVGGPAYLALLPDGMPHSSNVSAWAVTVREKARCREVIFAVNATLAAAYDEEPAASLVEITIERLFALADTRTQKAESIEEIALRVVQALDTAPDDALPTGFADLDVMLSGGVRKIDLTIIAGRPGAGKTSLGLSVAGNIAKFGVPTVFFSLEMGADALVHRLLSWSSRIQMEKIRTRKLSEDDYLHVFKAIDRDMKAPLYIQDSAATLSEISAWCERLKTEHNVGCVVIDYLQLMSAERATRSRETDVAAISRGLKRLAKRGYAVVALSQLNRSPEGRKDNRPRLGDLRESGTLEQDCDVAMLVFRPEQYDDAPDLKGVAEVIVAKNRQGSVGTTRLAFLEHLGGKFENLAR